MEDVTYGQLMDRAGDKLTVAWRQLQHAPPTDAQAARQAIIAFKDLGHALTMLATYLTGEGVALYRTRLPTDPRMRAAVRLVDALATAFGSRPKQDQKPPAGTLAARFAAAATAIRAATDLLATHTTAEGRWQTPQSPGLHDRTARLIALDRVADLVIAMAYARRPLSKCARMDDSMAAWMKVHRPPLLAGVCGFARELRAVIPQHGGVSVIDTARIANPAIRRADPVTELSDRIERMRVTAWRAAVYPSVETGVPTLHEFATAAVLVHSRAAILGARSAGVSVRDRQAPAPVRFLIARADQWRGVRKRLTVLLSPSIPDPALTEDLNAIRDLLGDLTTRGALYTRPGTEPRRHRAMRPEELLTVMREQASAFEAIAASNAMTIRVLHTAGLLHTPGKLLPGEETHAHPGQVTATFTRTSVPATREHINNILSSYGGLHSAYALGIPDAFETARVKARDGLAPGL